MSNFYSATNEEYRGLDTERPELPYGPYTCKPGFVWREAVPGDYVCVSPYSRDVASLDNSLGPSRKEPGGGYYGPDTCKQGFVWRESRPSDHVCVPPLHRVWAKNDNELAAYRMAYPPAAPSNGIQIVEKIEGPSIKPERRVYVSGVFTPNKVVEFFTYAEYDAAGVQSGLKTFAKVKADENGRINSWISRSNFVGWYEPQLPVIVVDSGTGIVSNPVGTVSGYQSFFKYY